MLRPFCDCGAERHGHLRGIGSPVLRGILGTNPPTLSIGLFRLPVEDQQKQLPITSPSKPRRGSAPPSDGLAPTCEIDVGESGVGRAERKS